MFHRLSRYSSPKNALIIVENNAKDGVFDPTIITSVSCDMYWECSNGYRETTTGTSHALSYTAPDSSTRKWVVRCAAGLGAIRTIEAGNDAITRIVRLQKCGFGGNLLLNTGNTLSVNLSDLTWKSFAALWLAESSSYGNLAVLGTITDLRLQGLLGVVGSLADLRAGGQTQWLYGCAGVLPASIAHLINIRDLRIYSMGWLIAATGIDVVINSVYSARASYTYASGIALRYGGTDAIPSGTEGTTPPADGVTNGDWEWDAVNEIHIPLTPQAKMFICSNDPYAEGLKTWIFTKV